MRRNLWSLLHRQPAVADPVSDAALLSRFADAGDQAAFELLVWRHGGLVYGVCRRILRDDHAAEDAFQATFLILARKAGSIRNGSAAGWLHRVARRVAVRAARQRRPEPLTADPPGRPTADPEVRAVLDAEIDRLPDRFRLPVLLCYLDGRPTEEAARELGIPRGTVLSRLATARKRLADRLTRGGITAPAVVTTSAVTADRVGACVAAAVRFAAGQTGGAAFHLANEVLQMSVRKTIGAWGAALVVAAGLATGFGVSAGGAAPGPDEPRAQAQPPKPAPAADPVKPDRQAVEESRRKQLAARYQALQDMQARFEDTIRVKSKTLNQLQLQSPNPHVIKALGEVLVKVELEIFQLQLDIRKAEAEVAATTAKLKGAGKEPIPQEDVFRVVSQDDQLRQLDRQYENARTRQEEIKKSSREPEKNREYLDLQGKIETLDMERRKLVDALRTRAEHALREQLRLQHQQAVKDAENNLLLKQTLLKDLEARRAELIRALDDRSRQSADLDRLQAEITQTREMADKVAREALAVQMELAGVKLTDQARPADDKLDQILKELADLKAEVRQLREQSKK